MVASSTAELLPSTNARRIPCTQAFHDLVKATPSLWALLKHDHFQPTYADEGEPQMLESRKCHCGSNLYVEVQS